MSLCSQKKLNLSQIISISFIIIIGVQRGGATVLRPPLMGHFVRDFTKTVDFFKYSPPLSLAPPLLSFSVRP